MFVFIGPAVRLKIMPKGRKLFLLIYQLISTSLMELFALIVNTCKRCGWEGQTKEVCMMIKMRTLILAVVAALTVSMPAHAFKHYDILMTGYYNGPSVSGTLGFGELFGK